MACTLSANAPRTDPTATRPLRQDFEAELVRRSKRVRGLVRRTVGYDLDRLDLAGNAEPPSEPFEYERNESLIEQFITWFRGVVREDLLETLGPGEVSRGDHWTASYLRQAYGMGWQQARGRLMQAGVKVGEQQAVEAVFNLPVPRSQLQDLYTRAYENLETITETQAQVVREELTKGLDVGENPRKIADRLTDALRGVERTRLRTLARTEIINSHSLASLDRYERAGVETVAHGEWATAGDTRVCPICQSLAGKEFPISEFRGGTFEFGAEDEDVADSLAGTYRLRPPAHPNGRCTILPKVV